MAPLLAGRLLESLLQHDPAAPSPPDRAYLDELRRGALTFLYRLLFLFYAEDRNLLPAGDARYDDYSLRKVREDLERRIDGRDALSERATAYHNHLRDLFAAVGEGDPAIGLPPYDGGLFEPGGQPLLDRARIPDHELAPLLDPGAPRGGRPAPRDSCAYSRRDPGKNCGLTLRERRGWD